MSYSVTGIAAISHPIPVLQGDAYSVPGSHRVLTALSPDVHSGVAKSGVDRLAAHNTVIAQTHVVSKVAETKNISLVDTVTLSTTQKVLKLQHEGESAFQIAATLNLPTKEVQGDLHIDTHVAQTFTVAPVTAPLSGNTTATVSVPTL